MNQPPFDHPFYSRHARYAYMGHHGRRFRFFPRLFWFAMGAGAFALWQSHKEKKARMIESWQGQAGQNRWSNSEDRWGASGGWGCGRRRERREAEGATAGAVPNAYSGQPSQKYDVNATASLPEKEVQVQAATLVAPGPTPRQEQQDAEWHSERIREIGKQAGDAMANISESALDSLLVSIQTLKTKLAEARAQQGEREKDKLYLEQRIPVDDRQQQQEQRQGPRRLV